MLRKFEMIMFVAATAVVVAITIGATRERTEAGNQPLASHNRIDPATLQLKVDIFNLHRATVELPY
jgi:hypothetical protein